MISKGIQLIPYITIWLLSFGYILAVQLLSPFIHESDPYYHIKVSEIIRTLGLPDKFHWTQHSIWKESYCDKDLLFHYLLIPFTYSQLILGAKIATAFFASTSITLLYTILQRYKINHAWLYIILLISSGPAFIVRFFILRTYLWSLTLALAGMYFILKNRALLVFVTGVIFSLSYNGAVILCGLSTAYLLSAFLHTSKIKLKELSASILGVITGFVLHPQSSQCVTTYNVQNIDVLFGSLTSEKHIPIAGELLPITLPRFYEEFPLLLPLFIITSILYLSKKTLRSTDASTLLFCCITFMACSFAWLRFIEYWAPFSIWFCAVVFNKFFNVRGQNYLNNFFNIHVLKLLFIFITAPVIFYKLYTNQRALLNYISNSSTFKGVTSGQWINNNVPKSEIIFVCDWQANASLFFTAPNHRFGFIGDPYYFLKYDEELYWRWYNMIFASNTININELCNDFKSKYIMTTQSCPAFYEKLKGLPNIENLYSNNSENVFKINQCP